MSGYFIAHDTLRDALPIVGVGRVKQALSLPSRPVRWTRSVT
jgi:hypothetical protein